MNIERMNRGRFSPGIDPCLDRRYSQFGKPAPFLASDDDFFAVIGHFQYSICIEACNRSVFLVHPYPEFIQSGGMAQNTRRISVEPAVKVKLLSQKLLQGNYRHCPGNNSKSFGSVL